MGTLEAKLESALSTNRELSASVADLTASNSAKDLDLAQSHAGEAALRVMVEDSAREATEKLEAQAQLTQKAVEAAREQVENEWQRFRAVTVTNLFARYDVTRFGDDAVSAGSILNLATTATSAMTIVTTTSGRKRPRDGAGKSRLSEALRSGSQHRWWRERVRRAWSTWVLLLARERDESQLVDLQASALTAVAVTHSQRMHRLQDKRLHRAFAHWVRFTGSFIKLETVRAVEIAEEVGKTRVEEVRRELELQASASIAAAKADMEARVAQQVAERVTIKVEALEADLKLESGSIKAEGERQRHELALRTGSLEALAKGIEEREAVVLRETVSIEATRREVESQRRAEEQRWREEKAAMERLAQDIQSKEARLEEANRRLEAADKALAEEKRRTLATLARRQEAVDSGYKTLKERELSFSRDMEERETSLAATTAHRESIMAAEMQERQAELDKWQAQLGMAPSPPPPSLPLCPSASLLCFLIHSLTHSLSPCSLVSCDQTKLRP